MGKGRRYLVCMLIAALLGQNVAYAAEWQQDNSSWYYEEDGIRQRGWVKDDTGWYHLDDNGKLHSGWYLEGQTWYFLNTIHDGYYGRALTNQWAWIDGYCYLFDQDGKMYADCTTPDGYTVNADGKWTVNGTVQYVEGKGIRSSETTETKDSYEDSDGGSSGGNSSGSGTENGEDSEQENADEGVVFEDFPDIVFANNVSVEDVAFTADSDSGTVLIPDSNAIQDWNNGEIYVLHDEETPWNDIAVKVISIEESEDGAIVHYEQPQLEELVDSVDISEIVESGGIFIPAEGVTAEDMSVNTYAMRAMSISPMSVSRSAGSGTFDAFKPVSVKLQLDGGSVSGTLLLNRVSYDYDADKVDGKIQINSCGLKADLTTTFALSTSIGGEVQRDIPLGKYIIPLSTGVWSELTVFADFTIEGGAEVGVNIVTEAGIRYVQDTGWDPTLQFSPALSYAKLSASASIMIGAEYPVKLLGIQLTSAGLQGGIVANGEAKTVNGDPSLYCMDATLSLVGNIFAELGDDFLSAEWEIYNQDLLNPFHAEETGIVKECTRKDCSYKGSVTDSITGQPVKEAKIELSLAGHSEEIVFSGEDGTFQGKLAMPHEYTVNVSAEGYKPYETTVIPQTGNPPELKIVLTPEDYNFKGSVVDAAALTPVNQAKIEIYSKGTAVAVLTTDASGVFDGLVPPATEYSVRISANGYTSYETTVIPQEGKIPDLKVELLPESASVGSWTADVRNKTNNEPISNAKVELLKNDAVLNVFYTDENGSCKGTNLEEGTYTLRVSADGFDEYQESFKITSGITIPLNITLVPVQPAGEGGWEAYVSSETTGEPISQALVWILKDDVLDEVYTNMEGFCEGTKLLESGDYRVWVRADGYETLVENIRITGNDTDTYYWKLQPIRDTEITTGIVGYVTCSENRSWYIPGAQVRIYQTDQLIKEVFADETGFYECELESGSGYTVEMSAPGYVTKTSFPLDLSQNEIRNVELNLEILTVPVTFNITVPRGNPVSVEAYFEMTDGIFWLDEEHFAGLEPDGDVFKATLWYGTYTLHIDRAWEIYDADQSLECRPVEMEITIDESNQDGAEFDIELEVIEEPQENILVSQEFLMEPKINNTLQTEEADMTNLNTEKVTDIEEECEETKENETELEEESESEVTEEPQETDAEESEIEEESEGIEESEAEPEEEPESEIREEPEGPQETDAEESEIENESEGTEESETEPESEVTEEPEELQETDVEEPEIEESEGTEESETELEEEPESEIREEPEEPQETDAEESEIEEGEGEEESKAEPESEVMDVVQETEEEVKEEDDAEEGETEPKEEQENEITEENMKLF